MSSTAKQKTVSSKAGSTAGTYRGVRIVAPRATKNFTVKELRQAVEKAIAKNPSLFATRK